MEWASIILYEIDDVSGINDLADLEPVLAASADDDDHDRVKTIVADDLMNRLRHLQERGEDAYGEAFNILDRIENPEVLKLPAVYLALERLFRGKSVSSMDTFAKRAEMYGNLYPQALDTAVRRLRWEIDMAKRRSGRLRLAR